VAVATAQRAALPALVRARAPGALRRHAPDIAFVAFLAGVAVVRYVVLADRGAPSTIDSGNWLAYGNALLGDETTRAAGIAYPPVVPLAIAGLSRAAGPVVAVAVVGALASVAQAAGTYAALRVLGIGWSAVGLAGLLAVSSATGEAAAWGGFPQLVAAGLVPLLLLTVDRALASRGWTATVAAAACTSTLLATSHFVVGYAAFAAVALVALHLAAVPRGQRVAWVRSRAGRLLVIAAPAALAVPLYLPLLTAVGGNRPDSADAAAVSWATLLANLEFTYRDQPVIWRTAILAALCAPVLLRDRWRRTPWRLAVASLLAVVLTTVLTREARGLFFLPYAAVVALAVWAGAARTPIAAWPRVARAGTAALLAAALAMQTWSGLRLFPGQRDYYAVVTPGVFTAMDWLRATPPDTRIGVSTVDDAPLGWWVEGYVRRPTVYASPLRWLSYADELDRARIANEVFSPDFPDETTLARARAAGLDYLLVATESNRFEPAAMASFLAAHPCAVALRTDTAIVLYVDAAGHGPGQGRSAAGCGT